jgi:hypothetical protein
MHSVSSAFCSLNKQSVFSAFTSRPSRPTMPLAPIHCVSHTNKSYTLQYLYLTLYTSIIFRMTANIMP